MLNFIWAGFIVTALFAACWQAIATGDGAVFGVMTKAMFDSAKTGFEISIGLTGVMTLWLGIMQIAERGGFIQLMRWQRCRSCRN